MSDEDAIKWLEECARYFERRDDGGEDMAFWANVMNAENARKIADRLRQCINVKADFRAQDYGIPPSSHTT